MTLKSKNLTNTKNLIKNDSLFMHKKQYVKKHLKINI